MMRRTFTLTVLAETFAVCQLPATDALPAWTQKAPIWSVTKTADEYSVVCPDSAYPAGTEVICEHDWKCLKVHGPFDFNEVGIIAALTSALAEARIGVFVISTYETDYLMVKNTNLDQALRVLSKLGHQIIYD